MPRVENMGDNVTEWCTASGEGSSTFDVCKGCAAKLETDPHRYDDELAVYGPHEPDGTDGRGGDCSAPDYDDEEYNCAVCDRRLTGRDN